MSRQRWLVLVSQKRSLRHCCPSKLLAYRSVVVPVMEMYTIKRGIFLGSTAPLIPLLILALYISFACNIVCFLSFFSSLFPYLCFLWEYTHSVSRPEVARGDQTWAFLVVLAYFKLQYFVLLMHDCLCSVSLGLVYILWLFLISLTLVKQSFYAGYPVMSIFVAMRGLTLGIGRWSASASESGSPLMGRTDLRCRP